MIQVRLIWHPDWPLKNLDKLQKFQCRCSFPGDFHSILQRSAWRRKFNKPIKLPIVFDPVFPSCQLHSVFPDCMIIRISVMRPQLFRCLYSELSIRAYSWTQSSFKEPFRFLERKLHEDNAVSIYFTQEFSVLLPAYSRPTLRTNKQFSAIYASQTAEKSKKWTKANHWTLDELLCNKPQ